MQTFHNYTLIEIIQKLSTQTASLLPREEIAFCVTNPDIKSGIYNGEELLLDGVVHIYRGYKTWIDLAHILGCKMLTPEKIDTNLVIIRYEKLRDSATFHQQESHHAESAREQKYGTDSIFSQIHKNEESAFLFYYTQALQNAGVSRRKRILNLGINSGDEFDTILSLLGDVSEHEFVGIDYCDSAINAAKKRFAAFDNMAFYAHDINDLASLNLGEFDLIISIGTLQSSNLEFNALLMSIVQNQLKRDGAMILGFPNCRWIDGEMIYGARVKNYAFSEMGLLYKDAIFAKKYLQQKKYRVTLTGKDYVFLSATSIRK